jgi:hypothetical protein
LSVVALLRRRRWTRWGVLRWLAGTALAVVLAMVLLFVASGLQRELDVGAGLAGFFSVPQGITIDAAKVPYVRPRSVEWLGNLQELDLSEASGIAASNRRDDVFWANNDSCNPHELFAFDAQGVGLGRVKIDDYRLVDCPLGDWEDMASFQLDGRPYLVVGDVGDNFRWRRVLELKVVEEPELSVLPLRKDATAPLAWTIRFRYPDGYHDCEALAVDEASERVLLITKREIPAELYEVPLRADPDPARIHVAARVASLDTIPQPGERDVLEDPEYGAYRAEPTALALAGDLGVVVTYGDAYVFERADGDGWGQALRRIPRRIALPYAGQREAATLSKDGRYLYVTSERGPRGDAALFRVDLADLPR